jgi:hypothetical protein
MISRLRYLPTLEQRERRYIARVLALCSGDLPRAARVLGIPRSTAYRKLKEFCEAKKKDPAPFQPPICPSCGDWISAVRLDGRVLTWNCRGGCNP